MSRRLSPAGWFRRLTRHAADDKIASLRQSVADARARADASQARATELVSQVRALSGKLAAARDATADSRARELQWRHEVPSPVAVASTFPHRLRTLSARRRAVQDGQEALLIAASPAYRDVLSTGPAALENRVHRMSLDGLVWWVPVANPAKGMKQAWIDKQRLPYHGIMATRDVAIGGIMLDLGAHIGRMSIPRVIMGDAVAAFCAEPDPVNYACLAGNVIDNGLRGIVFPDQTAIGDVDGSVAFSRTGAPAGFHVTSGLGEPRTIEVPCTTLDTWTTRLAIDLDAVTLVKVDVQGYEHRVIRGASGVLSRRHMAWQVEVTPEDMRRVGDDPAALYRDLAEHFTHFIDINRHVQGPRVRPTTELPAALGYIEETGKTDLLLFSGV